MTVASEPEALAALVAAAREVDQHLDPQNRGPLRDCWTFGGQWVSGESSLALLILHDCLNDLTVAREGLGSADG